MNRDLSERLMTVEEAMRLSDPAAGPDSHQTPFQRYQRASLWSWQTAAGAFAQTVTDEQVEQMHRVWRGK